MATFLLLVAFACFLIAAFVPRGAGLFKVDFVAIGLALVLLAYLLRAVGLLTP